MRALTNGWRTSGLIQHHSGDALTAYIGTGDNSLTGLTQERAQRDFTKPAYLRQAGAGHCVPPKSCVNWLNNAAFSVPVQSGAGTGFGVEPERVGADTSEDPLTEEILDLGGLSFGIAGDSDQLLPNDDERPHGIRRLGNPEVVLKKRFAPVEAVPAPPGLCRLPHQACRALLLSGGLDPHKATSLSSVRTWDRLISSTGCPLRGSMSVSRSGHLVF